MDYFCNKVKQFVRNDEKQEQLYSEISSRHKFSNNFSWERPGNKTETDVAVSKIMQ